MRWPPLSLRAVAGLACGLAVLAGCDRDGEAALRARLGAWFFLGGTLAFDSRARCTAAVFSTTVDRPKPALAVSETPEDAVARLDAGGLTALRVAGVSPDALTDALLLTGIGALGRQALTAVALSEDCVSAEVGGMVHEALTRPGATMAYDSASGGLMVLDPNRLRLIFLAGDVR